MLFNTSILGLVVFLLIGFLFVVLRKKGSSLCFEVLKILILKEVCSSNVQKLIIGCMVQRRNIIELDI